jgi:transposase
MKTLPRVTAEMALHVLAYNLTRVLNIMGAQPLLAAMRALSFPKIPSGLGFAS